MQVRYYLKNSIDYGYHQTTSELFYQTINMYGFDKIRTCSETYDSYYINLKHTTTVRRYYSPNGEVVGYVVYTDSLEVFR